MVCDERRGFVRLRIWVRRATVRSSHRRRSAQAHEAVLAAAADIAGRCGYGSATIETIAAQAGVGKQTIYRWWPNKAALFIEGYGRLVPSGLVAGDTRSLTRDFRKPLTKRSGLL